MSALSRNRLATYYSGRMLDSNNSDATMSTVNEAGASLFAGDNDLPIGFSLRRALQVHSGLWADEFEGLLTPSQFTVLQAVARWPGLDQTGVGRRASLDKSNSGDIIARLAEQGWIVRGGDDDDGRRIRLRLGAATPFALREILPRVRAVQERFLSPLSADEPDRLIDLLDRVADGSSSAAEREFALDDDRSIVLVQLLRRAQQLHTAAWSLIVGRTLTTGQYAVLSAIIRFDAVDQRRVREVSLFDKAVVVELVARLHRRGLLTRERDVDDGRRILLGATEAGRKVFWETEALASRVQHMVLEPLEHHESVELIRLLTSSPVATDDDGEVDFVN